MSAIVIFGKGRAAGVRGEGQISYIWSPTRALIDKWAGPRAASRINYSLARWSGAKILRALRDVSYTSFGPQKDDPYTGRGSVERRRRDLGLQHCNRVAVEQKFDTD